MHVVLFYIYMFVHVCFVLLCMFVPVSKYVLLYICLCEYVLFHCVFVYVLFYCMCKYVLVCHIYVCVLYMGNSPENWTKGNAVSH